MSLSLPGSPGSPTRGLMRPPCVAWRDRLETELLPKDSNVPEHRRLIPTYILDSLFNSETIQEILDCWCSQCEACRDLSGTSESSIDPKIITGHSESDKGTHGRAVVLFAVLVYLEFPLLVNCFLTHGIDDQRLILSTASFDGVGIRNIIGNEIHKRFPRFAERFHWSKHQFLVPRAQDLVRAGDYAYFPRETILPFANEVAVGRTLENGEIISEGSFGRVYRFDLLDSYGEFPEFPGVHQFARKELLSNTPEWRFNAERRNLLSVKKIGDDHLVKIVTAYRHGNLFNLIFPLAQTNLHRYLREAEYQPFRGSTCVVKHPIWLQLLGIARALYKVQNFHENSSSNEASRYGYHLDLKPANILVEDSGRLIITDFGQAVFKRATDSTDSRVRGVGGTETYAPPEFDDDANGVNRRYDIWSLGCIFLECLVFVIKGREGLLELDHSRVTVDPLNGNIDDRFCSYDGSTGSYALKRRLLDQIERLPKHVQGAADLGFYQKFLDLVLHMLDVNPKTRLTSAHTCAYLSKIINEPAGKHSIDVTRDSRDASQGDRDSEEIESIPRTLSLRVNGNLQSGSAQLLSDGTQLQVKVSRGTDASEVPIGQLTALRMIPEYALHNPGSYYFLDYSLSITPDDPTSANAKEYTFECRQDLDATCRLQKQLLGQEVVRSWKLSSAELLMRPRKFRRKSSASSTASGVSGLGNPSAIQLWEEGAHIDTTPHSPKRYFRPTPSHRRVVLYFSECILLLRIAKNFRLNKASQQVENHSSTLEFVPTSESTDRSFSATLLRKRPDMPAPSFALDRGAFEAEEANGRVECSSLALIFHTPRDATLFYESYRELKRQWREDVKHFDTLLGRVGSKMWDIRSK
ncbi:kinase-like domain-containing protein [Lophiotrema nucula]|uniref:Kinase-like domain-containing protein n=1 Tax=Lophiotrema nucula TaxID=690887 RepID=A0A6A5YRX6_9PLEO|nr:kinase-like domain-containing protein [Lophiotrema nucula]